MHLASSIREAKGIGEKTEKLFHNMGVYSVADMLLYFPRSYISYPDVVRQGMLEVGKICAFEGELVGRPMINRNSRIPVTCCNISDGYVKVQMTWFRMPYMASTVMKGRHVFYGRLQAKRGSFVMEQPKVFTPEQYEELKKNLQPLYPLTKGMKNQTVMKAVRSVLEEELYPEEIVPKEVMKKYDFPSQKQTFWNIHFPLSEEMLKAARRKLSYEEFLLFLIGIRYQKVRLEQIQNSAPVTDFSLQDRLIKELPYSLTEGQKKTLQEIRNDISGEGCMQRLVQGDVGSGKTILAFLTMISFAENGYQSAIMAPTEVLAKQHYENMKIFLEEHKLPFEAFLLIGSMKASEKKKVRERLMEEKPCLLIGTHALIQESVHFSRLGLVITDEQHRFGVRQRDRLSSKGKNPHILVMSATPIPRTLALILYGDLDVSTILGMPSSRLPIKNAVITPEMRPAAYKKMYKELEQGHQAYIICPLVEESEGIEAEDVVSYGERIREIFPQNVQIGVLHGRMKAEEKNAIMEAFAKNEIQILVSTTVIEVGINVPNATIMLIENAERFGLAQLHQLRGRVGRGEWQSYCMLMNASGEKKASERLLTLSRSNDGFEIAAEDLKLRGPGEYFGDRQSGEMNFHIADIYEDEKLLKEASADAAEILKVDPELTMDAHYGIRKRVLQYMKERENLAGL